MRTVELEVRNPSGLHARPAALFAREAGRFSATITVENLTVGSNQVNAKSVLHVLTTAVEMGHRIRLTAEGPDEEEAIEALEGLVAAGLDEPVET